MKTAFLSALMFIISTHLFASDKPVVETLVVEGHTYRQCTVSYMDIDNVVHMFSPDGTFQVPWTFLSPLMQQEAEAKRRPNIQGHVLQRVQGGMLVTLLGADQIIFLYHYPAEKTAADGDLVKCFGREGGVYHYTTTTGSSSTVHAFEFREPTPTH